MDVAKAGSLMARCNFLVIITILFLTDYFPVVAITSLGFHGVSE